MNDLEFEQQVRRGLSQLARDVQVSPDGWERISARLDGAAPLVVADPVLTPPASLDDAHRRRSAAKRWLAPVGAAAAAAAAVGGALLISDPAAEVSVATDPSAGAPATEASTPPAAAGGGEAPPGSASVAPDVAPVARAFVTQVVQAGARPDAVELTTTRVVAQDRVQVDYRGLGGAEGTLVLQQDGSGWRVAEALAPEVAIEEVRWQDEGIAVDVTAVADGSLSIQPWISPSLLAHQDGLLTDVPAGGGQRVSRLLDLGLAAPPTDWLVVVQWASDGTQATAARLLGVREGDWVAEEAQLAVYPTRDPEELGDLQELLDDGSDPSLGDPVRTVQRYVSQRLGIEEPGAISVELIGDPIDGQQPARWEHETGAGEVLLRNVGLGRVVTVVDARSDDLAVVDTERTAEGVALRVTAPAGFVQATPVSPGRSATEPVDEQPTAPGQEVTLTVAGPQEPFVVLLEWFGDDGSLGLVELRVG